MQLSITGRHVEVTPALKSFIQEKLAKLEELFPKVRKVGVVLEVEKYRHTAELRFHAEGTEFSAKKTTKDMYASVEACLEAVEHQAARRKDKLHSKKARRHLLSRFQRKLLARQAPEEDFDVEVEEAPVPPRDARLPKSGAFRRLPRIVRLRRPEMGPLHAEEAAQELVESGRDFLVFEDARTGRAHVMFRRTDGTLGLIEA